VNADLLRRAITTRALLLAAAVGLSVSACSVFSPPLVNDYNAGDGVSATITDPANGSTLDLRNFVVVAADSGGVGRLVGTAVNNGSTPVQLSLSTDQTSGGATGQAMVTVPAYGITKIGFDEGQEMLLSNVPAAGTFVAMSPKTDAGGTVAMHVPVVPAVGFYATLAPPTTLPSPSPTAVPSGTATGTSTGTATGTSTGTATPTPSVTTTP
jgi:hypothetical protein